MLKGSDFWLKQRSDRPEAHVGTQPLPGMNSLLPESLLHPAPIRTSAAAKLRIKNSFDMNLD